jgi:WhiB family redox-sensing transcriptional regulator
MVTTTTDDAPMLPTWRPSWHALAACRGVGTDVFFDPRRRPEADRLCSGCPVRSVCHQAAENGREAGVWAGRDAKDRRALRRAPQAS